jgi:arylsulfatase
MTRDPMPIRRLSPCLLGLLLLVTGCAGSDTPERRAPGVVLVVIDTLRADHLGAWGYERDTSPNLDRLAAEGERFGNAFAQSPWTLPAMATILTGRLPRVHGAGRDAEGRFSALRAEVPTLAELLSAEGYRTAAFVNVIFCSPSSGLARGFERYDFHGKGASNRGHRSAAETTDAALAWAADVGDDPFLLLVHYFDPHLTYDPPAPWDERFEPDEQGRVPPGFGSAAEVFAVRRGEIRLGPRQRTSLIARYDGEIRYVDEQFARLREGLERLGLWDSSLVVVVADHGEEFWEHGGFEHGHSHYRELLHVPLIVRRPGTAPALREERVRQLDILPTVLDFTGTEPPGGLPGAVLGSAAAAHSVAEGSLWAGDLLSVRSAEGTLIVDPRTGARQYFGPDDPGETSSLGSSHPSAVRLGALLDELPGPAEALVPWELTEEQRERLRSLGYLK